MARQISAEASQRRVQSIEVGFRVLRVLQTADGPLPLREIASRAEMPPSKAHLYLVSFLRENVAFQDAKSGHYGLGSFAVQLGLAAIRQIDAVALAADVITGLRDETDCAVYLSLWGDRGPCIVAKADGTLQAAFAVRLGYVLPMTSTATGLVFLAFLPEKEAEEALKVQAAFDAARKASGAPSRREMSEALVRVREQGFAASSGRLHRNFAGISAPIFDYGSKLAAALTLLGPTDFMTDERQGDLAHRLLRASRHLSQRLGAPGTDRSFAA